MESSIAVFLLRQPACERLPTPPPSMLQTVRQCRRAAPRAVPHRLRCVRVGAHRPKALAAGASASGGVDARSGPMARLCRERAVVCAGGTRCLAQASAHITAFTS